MARLLADEREVRDCEDRHPKLHKPVLDATRISDGTKVPFKLVHIDAEEIPIGLFFSAE